MCGRRLGLSAWGGGGGGEYGILSSIFVKSEEKISLQYYRHRSTSETLLTKFPYGGKVRGAALARLRNHTLKATTT